MSGLKVSSLIKFSAVTVLIIKILSQNDMVSIGVFFCAVMVHELCHLISGYFLGIHMNISGVGMFGLKVNIDKNGSPASKIILYSSGIVGNLLCVLLASLMEIYLQMDLSFFIVCNIVFAAINMIPSFPLDGGRALKSVLQYFYGEIKAVKITSMVGNLISTVMFFLGIYIFMFYTDNILLPVFSIFLIYNNEKEVALINTSYIRSLLGV